CLCFFFLGNTSVWHGHLDFILDCNLPVKYITCCDSDGGDDDETGRKRSEVTKSSVGVKRKAAGLKLNQQIVAEVIVSSFLNKKLRPYSSNFLLPCIGACGTDQLVVYFYDSEHDVLLESCQFELRNATTGALNLLTLIVIWLVVNYRYTCSGLQPYMMMKSNFYMLAEEKLKVYQEELRFGSVGRLDSDAVEELSDFPWNPEGLKDIDDEIEELKKYF
ncbi:uncharacterized protein LOC117319119, partial [Pecten maximus]|uniref:uncharacterized protein LOC117319119 n=1 Tax=Pecten maximus TaxID=6579 RepID=UPI0014583B3B